MPRDSNPDVPNTLADLWLKQPRASGRQPEPAAGSGSTPQLDLLFSAPVSTAQEPPPRRIFSVAELVSTIRGRLEHDHPDVLVEGEISNCRAAASGHLYFTLKDGNAQLPVVLFRNRAQLLSFRPQDGIAVRARGRVSIYEQRGQLQLIAESLEARGSGLLQLAFDRLKARLLAEGLFDSARKRPLPPFPHCIGVATSTSGAVLHDIIKVTRRRHARLNLLVYPVAVQGPGCAASVIAAIRFFNANPGKADLILIARGGGSIEDLAGFNDEGLARAIAASDLPVVSAVGHETDFTIADFVADLRAPTPSAAAEIITAAQHQIEARIAAVDARILRAARYHLMIARQRIAAVSIPAIAARLQSILGRRAQRVDDLSYRLESGAARRLRTRSTHVSQLTARLARHNSVARLALTRRRLDRANDSLRRLAQTAFASRAARLDRAVTRLHALSPLAVLDRGYALVFDSGGNLLRNAANAHRDEAIDIRLARGTLVAKVTKIAQK
ncbi:MAG TPA: exodeoxyribonuclease VII large subunit [Acidobacteriaceae bacterium]|nr:exodeoxyribonuclease VII large subunit [Acidobacteriaceae bacterium]